MKILITGIAGLMGSRLADWILENTKHEVVGIDDLSGGYRSNINEKAKFYHFDLSKNRAVSGTTYSTTEGTMNLKLIFNKEKIPTGKRVVAVEITPIAAGGAGERPGGSGLVGDTGGGEEDQTY